MKFCNRAYFIIAMILLIAVSGGLYSCSDGNETNNNNFSIHFIDVGQADAALVDCDGHFMLVDGGNKEDSSKLYALLKEKRLKN